MRAVEQAIRGVEEEQWRRSDPEKSARADDMVAKLEQAIDKVEADLEKARAAGDRRRSRARGEPRLPPVVPRDGPAGLRRLLRLPATEREVAAWRARCAALDHVQV